MSDLISRQSAIQSEQQHGRMFKGIVVEYPIYTCLEYKGRPYFSIKYTENGQEFIGYGTYSPEVLSEYLKEYFMPSAQLEIITCTECEYYDTDTEQCNNDKGLRFIDFSNPECMWCSWAERREE